MRGMSPVVKSIAGILTAPLCLFGVYVIVSLDTSHGAGFAGGVIIALAFMMRVFAFGMDESMRKRTLGTAALIRDIALGLLFTASAVSLLSGANLLPATGILFKDSLMIVLLNLALCAAVAALLYMVFIYLLSFTRE